MSSVNTRISAQLRAVPKSIRHLGEAIVAASPRELPAKARVMFDFPLDSPERIRLWELTKVVNATRYADKRETTTGRRGGPVAAGMSTHDPRLFWF